MKKNDNILIASEGMLLTNGVVYLKKIYLGENEKAENWHEITKEEVAEIMKAKETEEAP